VGLAKQTQTRAVPAAVDPGTGQGPGFGPVAMNLSMLRLRQRVSTRHVGCCTMSASASAQALFTPGEWLCRLPCHARGSPHEPISACAMVPVGHLLPTT
jgi:hypothetical protein